MNPIGAAIAIVLTALLVFAPRRWALLALLAGVLFLTQQQAIDVLGLNLTAIRLLEIAIMVRIVGRGEYRHVKLNEVDRAMFLAYGYTALVFVIRSDGRHTEIIGWLVGCVAVFRGISNADKRSL